MEAFSTVRNLKFLFPASNKQTEFIIFSTGTPTIGGQHVTLFFTVSKQWKVTHIYRWFEKTSIRTARMRQVENLHACGLAKCCRKQPRKINVSLLIAPFTDSQEMRLEYPLSKKGHNLITMNNTHLVVFFSQPLLLCRNIYGIRP